MSQKEQKVEEEKPEREFGDLLRGDKDEKTRLVEKVDRGVNVPNMPIWHGRLPGDRGGFRWWWWCVRT